MAPVLAHCDEEGAPAHLEASTERDRALYERQGFSLTGSFDLPAGGPPLRECGASRAEREPSSDVCLYIMNRTQIYLDDEQTVRLDERAAAEGTSRSMVIRRAVDVYLSHEEQDAAAWRTQWKKAIEGTTAIAPYLEEGADYVEGIRREDAERLSRFEH